MSECLKNGRRAPQPAEPEAQATVTEVCVAFLRAQPKDCDLAKMSKLEHTSFHCSVSAMADAGPKFRGIKSLQYSPYGAS